MRKATLFLTLCILSLFCFSQSPRFMPGNESFKHEDYVVRIIPGKEKSFGYDIIKDNKVVLHQIESPLRQEQVLDKGEIREVAKHVIYTYKKTGIWVTKLERSEVATLSVVNRISPQPKH